MKDEPGSEDRPDWSRAQWAAWWLDHADPTAAADVLEPGDVLTVEDEDLATLRVALQRHGLVLLVEDGQVFVYTPAIAREILNALDSQETLSDDRRSPRASHSPPASEVAPLKNSRGRR